MRFAERIRILGCEDVTLVGEPSRKFNFLSSLNSSHSATISGRVWDSDDRMSFLRDVKRGKEHCRSLCMRVP